MCKSTEKNVKRDVYDKQYSERLSLLYHIEDSKSTLFHCKATFIVVEKEIDLVMVGQSFIYIWT